MALQSVLPFVAGIFVGLLIAVCVAAILACVGLWWWYTHRSDDPVKLISDALPEPGTKEAEELVDQQTGALSIRKLRSIAEGAAFKRAGRAR